MAKKEIPFTEYDHLITPYFQYLTVENVPQSEIKGEAVMETIEVVQVRFAGDKNFSPVLPVHAQFTMNGHEMVTYAERWADQYLEFLSGVAQTAEGTPLEKLIPYGMTPSYLSMCRALKIHSIEALHLLEGINLKNLGMHTNALKGMARSYMDDRARGSSTQQALVSTQQEVEALRAELAAMRAGNVIPEKEAAPDEIEAAMEVADIEFSKMEVPELREYIKSTVGAIPQGNFSKERLVQMATQAKRDAA